ncbi:tetratricopeptide repeat protein [Chryseobacterium arthrosphaerae]|uniref:tetratricopeptide repeat protein n=1 Tax=Chryseobacterium arthrosphaerae TaxID=651561 RepID=UPI000F4D99AF|nr:tetratricopeptide repeat protein [Chryseobacterium arthrosphaerae]AYZ12852.1 tetratricopeptide repeat protein [Chryseobacterium arthrosphaerae]
MRYFIKFLIIVFLILDTGNCFAQTSKEQEIIFDYLYSQQPEKAKNLIYSKFLNSSSDSDKVIGYVYLADYYSVTDDEKKKREALEQAKKTAQKTGKAIDLAYVDFGYSNYYLKLNKNDLFIKSFNSSIKKFEKSPGYSFIVAQLYSNMAKIKAKNMLESDLEKDHYKTKYYALQSGNNIMIASSMNNLGYFYIGKYNVTEDRKYLDSAYSNFKKSYDYVSLIKDPVSRNKALTIYYINYASILREMETDSRQEESLDYSFKALALATKDKRLSNFVPSIYNSIGNIYNDRRNLKTAESYFIKAYNLAKNDDKLFATARIQIIKNLSVFYEENKNFEKALYYQKEAAELIKKEGQKQFDNNTKSLEIYYDTEQKNQQIKQLEEQQKSYAWQRILYLGIILLSCFLIVVLIFVLNYRQKISRQKNSLLEAEKKQAELVLQIEKEEKAHLEAEQELMKLKQEQLQKHMLVTSIQLNRKNDFLKELKDKLGNDPVNLEKALKEEQLTDGEFLEIQKLIIEVHPNFYNRINEVSESKLTNLDLKYATYIYLNLDNVQISNVLKADPNTVRTTKYRLKQKLGLKKEDDLQQFIQNLTK